MANKKIKSLTSFSHGRLVARPDEVYSINANEADELAAAGLCEIVGDAGEDEIDELVGSKMEPVTSNKMASKPANKGAK